MPQDIDTQFLSAQTDGYAYSFEAEARLLPSETGAAYRTAHGRILTDLFSQQVKGRDLSPLRRFARPTAIGNVHNISHGPNITSGGIIVKEPQSWDVAVPSVLESFFPSVQASGRDLLHLYGQEGFYNAALQLVVQRTDITPGQAHRADFGGWHDHMNERRTASIDLIYAFADVLETEFTIGKGREGALVRFGAEIKHRSPTNTTDSPLRRTWGAVIVTPHEYPTTYADNQLFDASPELRAQFIRSGQDFLAQRGRQYFTPETDADPETLDIAAA